MTLQEVVNCTPWRLPAPRWFSQYEWTVAENAVHTGIASVQGYSPKSKADAVALTQAISKQNSCPKWKQSYFGPGPAVATYEFGCLGSWWAGFNPIERSRILYDIVYKGLLCSTVKRGCPLSISDPRSWKPGNNSEHSAQKGIRPLPGQAPLTGCDQIRSRTAYMPMTGQQVTDLLKKSNGAIPPALSSMLKLGAQFFNRSFLVGLQFKAVPGTLTNVGGMNQMQMMLSLVKNYTEEIAIIWAPGQGISVRNIAITGNIDPSKMIALLQQMMGGGGFSLPSLPFPIPTIPGLPQAAPAQAMPWLNQVLKQVPNMSGTPGTPSNSGLVVVDEDAAHQDESSPVTGATSSTSTSESKTGYMLLAGAAAAAVYLLITRS